MAVVLGTVRGWSFKICSAITHVLAYTLAESAEMMIRCTRGVDGFVTFASATIATSWSDPSANGNLTGSQSPPFHGTAVLLYGV
jgi:hypothetical protein